MADIILKYLTDLPSASGAEAPDLMHINQDGNDRSITIQSLISTLVDNFYPSGITIWFNSNANPNVLFPGTVWARLPGAGRTIRIANSTGSDIGQMSGNDSVVLSTSNLPPHSHHYSGNTGIYDYGSKKTNNAGSHNHSYPFSEDGQGGGPRMYGRASGTGTVYVSTSGDHFHTTDIGAHSHEYSGDTEETGSSMSINITNSNIKQAAWYRVS